MKGMQLDRRHFLGSLLLLPASALIAAEEGTSIPPGSVAVRGTLETPDAESAALRLSDGSLVHLHGDEQTEKVLHDERLKGLDFEAVGCRGADGSLTILPIHLAALFVYEKGKRLRVTYYCDVCAIRTYSPGICMCCRQNTRVDLVDPASITGR